jgi:ABC-type transport system involved in multi-copper enzyme maturation permease subunit
MSEVLTLSRAFFINSVREKLFLGLLVGTFLLFGLAEYLSTLSLAEPFRVFSGFGSIAIWIIGILLIVTFCIFDFKKGFENRSAQAILARPISRWKYALAAFLSHSALLWLYSLGAFGIFWIWFRVSFGSWAVPVLYAFWVTALGLTLLAALALLCASLFETSILALIGFTGLFIVCLLNEPALSLAQRYSTHSLSKWTNLAITYLLPSLSHYRPAEIMAHNLPPPFPELAWLATYTAFFCASSLLLGSIIFNARDLP